MLRAPCSTEYPPWETQLSLVRAAPARAVLVRFLFDFLILRPPVSTAPTRCAAAHSLPAPRPHRRFALSCSTARHSAPPLCDHLRHPPSQRATTPSGCPLRVGGCVLAQPPRPCTVSVPQADLTRAPPVAALRKRSWRATAYPTHFVRRSKRRTLPAWTTSRLL